MNQDVTMVDEKNRWRLETPGHQGVNLAKAQISAK
jgi:hypothetical protein